MAESFFTSHRRADDGEWFAPTDFARGPWDPDACHGGPPTALLVRAMERAVPAMRLARISVDLGRSVPMAGFTIVTEVTRTGRSTANTTAAILDGEGRARATASGVHLTVSEAPLFEGPLDNDRTATPRLADSVPGEFPIARANLDHVGFRHAVEIRYPPGEDSSPGSTTAWMRTVPLLADEEMSPFQRISPLADCGNAFGRNMDAERFEFINTDLVVALHRDPLGEWLGTRASSTWQPSGSGVAHAMLFDDQGAVGWALQTLLVRRTP